jgi:hypothetical protein
MKPRFLLFCLLFPWIASAASAAEFRILAWGQNLSQLYLRLGTAEIEVVAGEDAPTPPRALPANRQVVLHRRVVDDKGTSRLDPVATFTAPVGLDRAILLVAAQPDGTFEGRWFADRFDPEGPETIRLINTSRRPIAIRLDDATHELAPGAEFIHPCTPGTHIVRTLLAAQDGGEWKLVGRQAFRIHPRLRVVGLIREGRTVSGMLTAPLEIVAYREYAPDKP